MYVFDFQNATGTGLEQDDLRNELSEWHRKYVNVDTLLAQRGHVLSQDIETKLATVRISILLTYEQLSLVIKSKIEYF